MQGDESWQFGFGKTREISSYPILPLQSLLFVMQHQLVVSVRKTLSVKKGRLKLNKFLASD